MINYYDLTYNQATTPAKNRGVGLIGAGARSINPGNEFAQYYTKPAFNDKTEIKKGTVNDTCLKIKELVKRWKHQTVKISKVLALSDNDRQKTAYRIWNYYHTYFQYAPDREGVEELRSPRRAFWDRTTGVDCDCFSTSIECNLANINASDSALKIIRRKVNGIDEADFSHIYVVWAKTKGKVDWDDKSTYWTIDPVVHTFNEEVDDIIEYKIYPMIPINTLDGLGNAGQSSTTINIAKLRADLNNVLQTGKAPNGYPVDEFTKTLVILLADPSQYQKAITLENLWQQNGFKGPKYFNSGLGSIFSNAVDKLKNFGDSAAHITAGGVFVLAREGLKQCLKFNVFGFATIMAYIAKTNLTKYNQVLDIWYNYGGDRATFTVFVNEGKTKVPRQVAPEVLNKIPLIKGVIEKANYIHYNHLLNGLNNVGSLGADPTGTTETASALTAAPIIAEILVAVLGIIAGIKSFIPPKTDDQPGPATGDTNTGNNPPPPPTTKKTNYTVPAILGVVAAKLLIFS